MIFKTLQYDLPVNDDDFDIIYPKHIQSLSDIHWTSVDIAKRASKFLVTKPGTKVLDIGSGVGKFCIVGALITQGYFYGVEYRKEFVNISKKIISDRNISNIKIIYSNILDITFCSYDAFYFFNSFYENLDIKRRIDSTVKCSTENYLKYKTHMLTQLLQTPAGTRLVTYSGLDMEIPSGFKLKEVDPVCGLKFWIKEEETKIVFI